MKTKTVLEIKEGESCAVCLKKSEKYNGWTNYETWAIALWIDNEQASYTHWRDLAAGMLDHAKDHHESYNTPVEEATYKLSNRLKDELEREMPEMGNSIYSDLLTGALSSVNWYEIAKSLFDK